VRVGKPHGLDGSFYVDAPLDEGDEIVIAGQTHTVVNRRGTEPKPFIRISGIDDRDAAEALRGQTITRADPEPLGEDEWLVEDLVGCRIEGVGEVSDVLEGLSCDVLEVGDELIPLVTDAVTRVDVENKVIEVDREFLGL
jgi:16S rRNA processing protein RimM